MVPLFPELRPYLEDCYDLAEPGTKYVITRYRDTNANLRTQLLRIINRAGLKPWPKLFQNLRSTRQTELEETFPSHVVCAWIGNSEQIARKHYLQVTDEHFERAINVPPEALQNALQSAHVSPRTASQSVLHKRENPRKTHVSKGLCTVGVEDRGLAPLLHPRTNGGQGSGSFFESGRGGLRYAAGIVKPSRSTVLKCSCASSIRSSAAKRTARRRCAWPWLASSSIAFL